jgi:flagellar export protein FliJ
MKRFRFALSGLEKIRQVEVDRAYAQLAQSERARREKEQDIMNLNSAIADNTGVLSRQGTLDTVGLTEEARHLGLLCNRREAALERLDRWMGAVETDRLRLAKARKEHQAIERLRERRYLEFVREVLREETRELDEAGALRFQGMRPSRVA